MKTIYDNLDFYTRLLDMLEQQMGPSSEILLHDLTKDYNHTIVDIRNGHITGRKIGDCGSNLGLRVLSGQTKDGDVYNYITHTKNGLILRSSTVFLKDYNDNVIGALCINEDITLSLEYEQHLNKINRYQNTSTKRDEFFVSNVNELLDCLIQEALAKVGKTVAQMDKKDKCDILRYLDEKGAFVISKSSENVAEFLGISKYTFYNYLDQIRENKTI